MVCLVWGKGGLFGIVCMCGEFEKMLVCDGIKVQWIGFFFNYVLLLQVVIGGSVDFGFGGSIIFVLVVMIVGLLLVFMQFVVVELCSMVIIVKDGLGINKVSDLVGKMVVVNCFGFGEFLLVVVLEKYGIVCDKVNFVYFNLLDVGFVFLQGKVDVWFMWSLGVDIVWVEYKVYDVFFEGCDFDFLIDFNFYVVYCKFVEENVDIVCVVNVVYCVEGEWISKNLCEVEGLVQKDVGYFDVVCDLFIKLVCCWEFYGIDDVKFIVIFQGVVDWLVVCKILLQKV